MKMVSEIDMMCLIFECKCCTSPHSPLSTNAAVNLTAASFACSLNCTGNGRRKKKRSVIWMCAIIFVMRVGGAPVKMVIFATSSDYYEKIRGSIDIYVNNIWQKFQVKIPSGRWSYRTLMTEKSDFTIVTG
jgi:hypothetical protein